MADCNCVGTSSLGGLSILGMIAAWCHGWGFWAGLFWQYWLAAAIIKWIS